MPLLLSGKRGGNFPQQPLGRLQSETVHGVTHAGHILANAGFGVVIAVTDAATTAIAFIAIVDDDGGGCCPSVVGSTALISTTNSSRSDNGRSS